MRWPTGTASLPTKWQASGATSTQHEVPGYCLDANLSYKVADALALVGHPVMHVRALPGNTARDAGQCDISDEDIARWCASRGWILVTCDEDFRGRWIRSGLLEREGAEVIVFERELPGLQHQHEQITARLSRWNATLGTVPRGHRVWLQGRGLSPRAERRRRRT